MMLKLVATTAAVLLAAPAARAGTIQCTASSCYGTAAAETVLGTAAADTIFAQGGNDTVKSYELNDKLNGQGGNDKLYGGYGNDTHNGGPGRDLIDGGPGSDTADFILLAGDSSRGVDIFLDYGILDGGQTKTGISRRNSVQEDTLVSIENATGTRFADSLSGTDGANTLRGGDGDDDMRGMMGNDKMYGGRDTDSLFGDDASSGGSRMTMGGSDKLYGEDGDDHLVGMYGDDYLSGGPGNDHMTGSPGDDILNGGPGLDRFYWDNSGAGYAMYGAGGSDVIEDFVKGEDWLTFHAEYSGGMGRAISGFADLDTNGNLVLDELDTYVEIRFVGHKGVDKLSTVIDVSAWTGKPGDAIGVYGVTGMSPVDFGN